MGMVLSAPAIAEEASVETRRAHFIDLYDVDGDGKLNKRELHAARKAQADKNEDGRLNRDEREDIRDRREDVIDRREDVRDRREDVVDRREDVRDRREDIWDANHNYEPGTPAARRDRMEDVLDRREDIRDRREDVVDRREDIRDKREDVRDRREDVRDRKIQRPKKTERVARTR